MTNLIHNCFILQYVYYDPLHVSSINMLIIRKLNWIDAASGIVALSKWPSSGQVEGERRSLSTCAQSLYFTMILLWSSKCFEHFVLIIRRLNWIDAASGIVALSKWLSGAQVERERSSLSTSALVGHWLRGRYQMLHQYSSASWWWACNARNM
jgi:hypothetical protein